LHTTQVKKRVEPEPETTNGNDNANANANDSGNRKHVMFVTGLLMAFHETDQTCQVQLMEPDEEKQETWTVDQVDWGVLLCQSLDNVCVAKWFDEELHRGAVVDVTADDKDNANDNHTCICYRALIVDCYRTIFICKYLTAQFF
jgi:hypothetical protein